MTMMEQKISKQVEYASLMYIIIIALFFWFANGAAVLEPEEALASNIGWVEVYV